MIKLKFEHDPTTIHIVRDDFADATVCGEAIGDIFDGILVHKKPTCEQCILKHKKRKNVRKK